jgi:hypothetical protein
MGDLCTWLISLHGMKNSLLKIKNWKALQFFATEKAEFQKINHANAGNTCKPRHTIRDRS